MILGIDEEETKLFLGENFPAREATRSPARSKLKFTVITLTALAISVVFLLLYQYHPQLSRTGERKHPNWLIATITPASAIQRRIIIRNTWQKLYKDDRITTRFVIANPDPLWGAIIQAENATYGDIITLSHIEESPHIANTIKSVEFFKHITSKHFRWDFVSKLDDDSYLDARNFYNKFLRLDSETKNAVSLKRTIIGRTLNHSNWTYPGGQFYTMSWDMVSLLADLHRRNPIVDEHEDVLIGRLLHEAKEEWHHVDLPSSIAFDYEAKDLWKVGSAFAAKGADMKKWRHAVGPQAINPHKLRNDIDYLKVAACFDKNGVIHRTVF